MPSETTLVESSEAEEEVEHEAAKEHDAAKEYQADYGGGNGGSNHVKIMSKTLKQKQLRALKEDARHTRLTATLSPLAERRSTPLSGLRSP
jgi:hypothetical protein